MTDNYLQLIKIPSLKEVYYPQPSLLVEGLNAKDLLLDILQIALDTGAIAITGGAGGDSSGGAEGAGAGDHAHDAPVDERRPLLLVLAHHAPRLALMEVHVAVAEPEEERVDPRARQLVDGVLELGEGDGRVEPLGVVVVGVLVVQQPARHHVGLGVGEP